VKHAVQSALHNIEATPVHWHSILITNHVNIILFKMETREKSKVKSSKIDKY
jgi:hypothetical protein